MQRLVGHHAIGEFQKLERQPLLGGDRLDRVQDLGVRAGGDADARRLGHGLGLAGPGRCSTARGRLAASVVMSGPPAGAKAR